MNAAIFPGQGSQLVGMGKDVAALSRAAADTFAEADAVLGFGLSKLCFEGPEERLNATDVQQPAIFATSVALFRAALERKLFASGHFAVMGGLSLGEYTALHLANAFSFADGLKLVYRRGQLMQQCAEQQPGGMASIIGGDEAAVLALCEAMRVHGRVAAANFNCPGQIVISGDQPAIAAAAAAADQFGCKAVVLKVAGAFHSELMRPAADALRETLAATEIRMPQTRVVGNVDAQYHTSPAAIRESLYRQVYNPVRWQGCVERLVASGATNFWEIGPNRVLAGLNRKIDRTIKTTNIGSADAFATP